MKFVHGFAYHLGDTVHLSRVKRCGDFNITQIASGRVIENRRVLDDRSGWENEHFVSFEDGSYGWVRDSNIIYST